MGPHLRIANARVPLCLLDGAFPDAGEQVALVDLDVADGRVSGISPAGREPAPEGAGVHDQGGGQDWPGLVDVHTHLDKGHIWPRAENPDGTFEGAQAAALADRIHLSEDDVRRRIEFGLRAALALGTVAIRTHLDSRAPQHRISWPLYCELRDAWAGRIALQAVSLVSIEELDGPFGEEIADLVAESGGVLGAFTYMLPEIDRLLDRILALAAERHLDLDFHVDETADAGARSLHHIAEAALRHRYEGNILCGHCCSLALQEASDAERTLDRVRAAGIAVVSLPMCNLYLMNRVPGRTPRWRGVTLLHEMAARGIPVTLGSDNCRDPFHAYGDHDVLEVFREGARIAHLDRPVGAWPAAVARTPAQIMALPETGVVRIGAPADLVLFRGRRYSELLSRPQSDRIVLRAGQPIDTTPPDYRELDTLLEG
jgi:cytosine deaminase